MFMVSGVCWSSSKKSFLPIPLIRVGSSDAERPTRHIELMHTIIAHIARAGIPIASASCNGSDSR